MEMSDLAAQELASATSTRDLAAPSLIEQLGKAFDDSVQIAQAWLTTSLVTDSDRHFATAISCRAIGQEHFRFLLMGIKATRAEQAARRRQRRDEAERIKAQNRDMLAASRRILHLTDAQRGYPSRVHGQPTAPVCFPSCRRSYPGRLD